MVKEKMKKLAAKAFPNRPDCKYANEKKYSSNDMNQMVREAMLIALDWVEQDKNKKR